VAYFDGTMVRPRWQPEPPNLPDYGTDWCATGIVRRRPLGAYPAAIRYPAGAGYDEMQRHEEFDLLCSFYGPGADQYAANLHDGLGVWQNYAPLRLAGMAYVECREAIRLPELIKERWVDRVDKTVVVRRIIRRAYPILNLLSAEAWIITDQAGAYTAVARVPPQPWTGLRQDITSTSSARGAAAVGLAERVAATASSSGNLTP
jgi:hypothetical protein